MKDKELNDMIYDFMIDNQLKEIEIHATGGGVNLVTEITTVTEITIE